MTRYVVRHISVEDARKALNLDPTKATREAIKAILAGRSIADHAKLYDACAQEEFSDPATASWYAVGMRHNPDTYSVTGYVFDDDARMIDAFDWEVN